MSGRAGDQIDNLLWRLQHGETPQKAPKVAVVLIGTNDFGAVDLCSGTDTDLLDAVPGVIRRYAPNCKQRISAASQVRRPMRAEHSHEGHGSESNSDTKPACLTRGGCIGLCWRLP